MGIYYCDECRRIVQYLNTPLYNELFKCLIKEYIFTDVEFIEFFHSNSEKGTYSLPITCKCELNFLNKMLFRKIMINTLPPHLYFLLIILFF